MVISVTVNLNHTTIQSQPQPKKSEKHSESLKVKLVGEGLEGQSKGVTEDYGHFTYETLRVLLGHSAYCILCQRSSVTIRIDIQLFVWLPYLQGGPKNRTV